MVKHPTLFQSTIGATLLSALLISTSAHAGLLGGAAAGGVGGGLNSAFTPRSLSLDGHVAGQARRDSALLPSRDAVKSMAGDGVRTGKDAGEAGAFKATETKAMVTDSARDNVGTLREHGGNASGNASGTAAVGAGASRNAAGRLTQADGAVQTGGALSRTAPSAMPSAPAAPNATPTPSNSTAPTTDTAGTGGEMVAARRHVDASASGSGQVSRTDRSVKADASTQASAQR